MTSDVNKYGMMAKKKLKRDENGDIKFEYNPNNDYDRYWDYTYVFKFYDKKEKRYQPYFGLGSREDEKLELAKKNKDFVERQLYVLPSTPPIDKQIAYHNWQLSLLVEYFKESFDIRAFEQGFLPSNKYFRVILPKKINDAIVKFIEEYKLEIIQDLIFEIICTAQKIFTEDVSIYDNKEYSKRIKNIGIEVKKMHTVLERMFDNSWIMAGKKSPPQLQEIRFVYHNGKIVTEDSWLARDILQGFKEKLEEDSFYKNWKLELDNYASSYLWITEKLNFRYNFTLSLYNLLTKVPSFKSLKKTPNRIVSCIAELVEFCLIPISSEGTSKANQAKVVRNWIDRKKLNKKITYLSIKPNKKRLLKYFDSDFINFGSETKRADALILAFKLGKRFNMMDLKADFAHLVQCLKESSFCRSAQLSLMSQSSTQPPSEFNHMLEFYKAAKNKKKITSVKFKVEGTDEEFELKDRLPLFIVEEAIKNHLKNYAEDFEVDLIKGKTKHLGSGKYETKREPKFNLPEERFMVTFVSSFFKYLLTEVPPKEYESLPSEKYYAVIAVILQHTWFFNQLRDPEEFLISKVKAWHKLSKQPIKL